MIISFEGFNGLAPKYAQDRLPDTMSYRAVNMAFQRGLLEPFKGFSLPVDTPPLGTKAVFRYQDQHWLFFQDSDVSVVDAHQVSDPWDYLLLSYGAYPTITRNDIATTSLPYPSAEYRLGVVQPGTRPGFYPTSGSKSADEPDPEVDIETRTVYRFSFVDGFGREGALSPPTRSVSFYEKYEYVEVPVPSDFAPIGTNVSNAKVRIYRAGFSSGEYQYVDEVTYGTTNYNDYVETENLGLPPETEDWYPPPDDDSSINPGGPLRNLNAMPGGFFVGSSGNELCASVPDAPHAWPYSYRVPLSHKIMGITVAGNSAIVATEGPLYVTQGVSPGSLQPTRVNTNQSCVSPRSMVNVDGAVIYAAPDGLVGILGYKASVITEELLTKEEWQRDFRPSEIHAYYYEGKYIFFNSTKGWIFRPGGGRASLSELDFHATAGYVDTLEDKLYLVVGGDLKVFDSDSAAPLAYQWESKAVRSRSPQNFSYMRCISYQYPVTLELVVKRLNGSLRSLPITFSDHEPASLPGGFVGKEFIIKAVGSSPIKKIELANSRLEFDDA